MDDMLILGEGDSPEEAEEDHDKNLRDLMDRCRITGLKLNPEKFRYKLKRVTYVGHTISSEGLGTDPEKVEAIKRIESPVDKKSLQRLLGMVNYLAKFVPNLSDLCTPMRQLLQKNASWLWTANHEATLEKVKAVICNSPVLRYFDARKHIVIQCDASSTGLGRSTSARRRSYRIC